LKLDPRTQLLLIGAIFLSPIAASVVAYNFMSHKATANYGELIAPGPVTSQPFERPGGARFTFAQLAGRWVMVASDSGACETACIQKLEAMRQVRLALGRNAMRVERVFVVDDVRPLDAARLKDFEGMEAVRTPPGLSLPTGAANDRAHVYLVDPRGNVMLRWPAAGDRKRMLKDMERLLKASQIG
jgi:cytochrome oxidase Cu insertion factor (SCO1/SenC/PrrC family)